MPNVPSAILATILALTVEGRLAHAQAPAPSREVSGWTIAEIGTGDGKLCSMSRLYPLEHLLLVIGFRAHDAMISLADLNKRSTLGALPELQLHFDEQESISVQNHSIAEGSLRFSVKPSDLAPLATARTMSIGTSGLAYTLRLQGMAPVLDAVQRCLARP